VRYHIEPKIYRPHLSPWRVLLGTGFACLTIVIIVHTLRQTSVNERTAGFIATFIVGITAFLFNFNLYHSYFFHCTPNGISALAASFSSDDINREIANLDFEEIVNNTGILMADNWLALQAPGDKLFILLPLGMIRFVSYREVLRNNGVDDSGESYNEYTFSFYLTNGQCAEYRLPLEYYGKKARHHKVNSRAVEEKFEKVQVLFLTVFGERFLTAVNKAWNFLYAKKQPLLVAAFDKNRRNRSNQDVFAHYIEFIPLERMRIEEEKYHVNSTNKAVRYSKVTAWLALIFGQAFLFYLSTFESLSTDDQLLLSVIQGALFAASIAMLAIYTYEIIKTLIHRKRARKLEKKEITWLKGMGYWYVRRENSLILKLFNIVIWSWILLRNLKLLL
jgi:hypothetical protein